MTIELSKIGNTMPRVVPVMLNQGLSNILLFNGGNNFTTPPSVSVYGGGGSGASANATISNNQIDGLQVGSSGSLYTSLPKIIFSGGRLADTRDIHLLKILTILTIRNITGSMASVSEKMTSDFTWASKRLIEIRNGQGAISLPSAPIAKISGAYLIKDSFKKLG